MALTQGKKLGPYEIVAPLGAGGMGEVYRARDTRLGRDVAIKVLSEGLSGDSEVRARFEREAKTVSSLNHPHICTLYDVGRDGEVDFLVMELVEGETLAQRLARGALPIDQALEIGAQIADALDRAHRAGVVHRDLKPGNIMLTRSGAKLMDFGLARVAGPDPLGEVTMAGLTQSPTVAEPLTAEGTILGTLQYMAPEQLEAQETDERADLWALGCVLYEMVTGHCAFQAKSRASVIAAIMHTDPTPVSQAVPLSPPQLDRLVSACLAKDPAERVQSAHDVKLQLAWITEGGSSPGADVPRIGARRRRPTWVGLAAVAIVAAAATAALMGLWPRRGAEPVSATAPQRFILGAADMNPSSTPMLTPDGRQVVFSVAEGPSIRLYRRDLSSWDMTPIAGTEGGSAPFFSPDGAWIGFCTADGLKKVPAGGGVAQMIASYPRASAGDWGADGMIYFTARAGGMDGATALARVPEMGGKVEVVLALDVDAGETESWLPEILPDTGDVLVSVNGGSPTPWRIVAARPDGTHQVVVASAFLARYVAAGYLVYTDQTSQAVLAAPFDPAALTITGPAVPLTEEVDPNYCFDVLNDGIVYVPSPTSGQGKEVIWLDRDGKTKLATSMKSSWTQPRISPDGKRVLLRKVASECELWMLDVERQSLGRIVQDGDTHDPVWAPDGRRIAFRRKTSGEMVTLVVIGPREIETLAKGRGAGSPQSWSGGNNLFAYTVTGHGSLGDIWVRRMDTDDPPTAFLETEFDETLPDIAPDGRSIAYVSDETGTQEVYVRRYPDTGTAWQVSIGGGTSPLWSRDGRQLYYVTGTKMMVVPVATDSDFSPGNPRELFDGGFSTARARDFDVGPDGRFITVRRVGGEGGLQEIRVLLNWRQEVARLGGEGH